MITPSKIVDDRFCVVQVQHLVLKHGIPEPADLLEMLRGMPALTSLELVNVYFSLLAPQNPEAWENCHVEGWTADVAPSLVKLSVPADCVEGHPRARAALEELRAQRPHLVIECTPA